MNRIHFVGRLLPRTTILSLITAIGVAFSQSSACAGSVKFIALGDLPYTGEQQQKLDDEIGPAIRTANAAFVIHYGDFKKGSAPCTEKTVGAALDEIFSLSSKVIYTPGDNDWADCDRKSTGSPVSELFMLDRLRNQLKNRLVSQRDTLPKLQHQPLFVENAIWSSGKIVFVTLHMVGTNNGRDEILLDKKKLARTLVQARDFANRVWLKKAWHRAVDDHAKAIVVISQADPTSNKRSGTCKFDGGDCDGYKYMKKKLREVAANWGKPMLYIHGDTNPYCLDKGFGGDDAPKLWRLNATGDYAVVDATSIEMSWKNDSNDVSFDIRSLLGGQAPADGC